MVNAVTTLKEKHSIPCTAGADSLGCAYSSFKRWKHRIENGKPAVNKPGPAKVEPLDYDQLMEDIGNLKHGRKRTKGTGELYQRYSDQISKREVNELVRRTRNEINQNYDESMKRIIWNQPNVAWGMDDMEDESKKNIHNIRDMCSRYQLAPLTGKMPSGKQVAANLERNFKEVGVPLILKKDNGSNLNSKEVQEVLEKYMVIPLNSPCFYPKYNGSIENGQGEMKKNLAGSGSLQLRAELAAHKMNHKSKPCLKNNIPCRVFWDNQPTFNRRKRKEVFLWIKNRQLAILDKMEQVTKKEIDAAWRVAVERWLQLNGFITVQKGRRCYQV